MAASPGHMVEVNAAIITGPQINSANLILLIDELAKVHLHLVI